MTDRLGRKNIEHEARKIRVLAGYSGTPSGTTDHGSLTGLGDDDHAQYVHISAVRTITAQHSFSPAGTQPPFVLGANAQSQLVTGLRADQLSKTVTAGAGLTGGGTLTGNITLTIGAGNGITVNADDVAINLGSPSGLTFSGSALVVDDAIAGAGLTISSKVLAVGAGDGLAVNANDVALKTPGTLSVATINDATNAHTHEITSSSNPGAAASLLASNASGYLQLVRLGAGVSPSYPLHARLTTEQLRLDYDASNYSSFTVGSGGNLTVAPTGDFIFDPAGNDILPTTGYDLNIGSLQKKYLTLHAAELWVETLVAQNTIATIGGRIVVTPTTTLIADLASGGTTMDVKHNQMSNGDRVLMQANGSVEWMAITSAPTAIAGGYRYSVTRDLDGTGANNWYAGDAVVNTRQTGSGFMDLYSLESVTAKAPDYIFAFDASAGTYSANYADLSNFELYPTTGETGDRFYIGFSTQWAAVYFYMLVAGVYTSIGPQWKYWNGAWTNFTPTTTPDFKSTGEQDLVLGTLSGWTTTSVNGKTAWWVTYDIGTVSSWTTTPQQGTRRVLGEKSQWGPTIVGWGRNSSTYNDLTEHWAIGNLNGLYGYGVDTYGVGLGKYGTGSQSYITIDASNGLRIFNGSTIIGKWDTSGNVQMGAVATNNGNAYWNNSNKRLEFRGGTGGTVVEAYIGTDGSVVAGAGAVKLNADGIFVQHDAATITTPDFFAPQDKNAIKFVDASDIAMSYLFGVRDATNDVDYMIFRNEATTSHGSSVYLMSTAASTEISELNLMAGFESAGALLGVGINLYYDPGGSSFIRLANAPVWTTDTVYIGDTANANMTVGLTINQGANDDELLALKSSDVAHGMTDMTETDTYALMAKQSGATGGLRLSGFSEDIVGLNLLGFFVNEDTSRSTAATGAVMTNALKKSGTGTTTPGANANLFVVRSNSLARFLVDAEGDIHMDATSNINAWDEFDDVALLAGVREAMNPSLRLREFVEEARPVLERTGVVSYNPDGHHFISLKKLHGLEIDAMRQLYQRNRELEERVEALERFFTAKDTKEH